MLIEGAKRSGITFSPSAVRKIVIVASGYPHFAHLLALKAAELVVGNGETTVQLYHVQAATDSAAGDAEGSLRSKYEKFVRSATNDEFRRILVAATAIPTEEFSAAELRESYTYQWGIEITQGWLNNYLKRIVALDDSAILRRIAKGVYKFGDPRMKSYIRLANLADLPDDGGPNIESESAP